MGRPTSERKEKTVKLRVSEEMYSEIEGYGDNISESIRELIRNGMGVKKRGEIPESENVPQKEVNEWKTALLGRCKGEADEFLGRNMLDYVTIISNSDYVKLSEKGGIVPQNTIEGMSEKDYKDLESMCKASYMTVGQFMESVYRLFNDGKIYIDGTVIKTRGECDLRALEDMCHRFNADPQDMIDKLVKSLIRG